MSNRRNMPMTDTVSTLTLKIEWDEDAIGKAYHVVMLLQNRVFDNQGTDAAQFAFLSGLRSFVPEGVRLRLLNSDIAPSAGPLANSSNPFEPRLDPVYTLQFEVYFPDDAPESDGDFITVYGPPLSTAIPLATVWPILTSSAGNPFKVRTPGGSEIPIHLVEIVS